MGKRKAILVADDSQSVRDALAAALTGAGYESASAAAAEEVLPKLAAHDPEVVFLDLYMPGLNGADVCRLVKAHPRWKRAHLVLMSSRMSDTELEPYRRIGVDAILRKPFDPAAVVEMVAKAIGAPEPDEAD